MRIIQHLANLSKFALSYTVKIYNNLHTAVENELYNDPRHNNFINAAYFFATGLVVNILLSCHRCYLDSVFDDKPFDSKFKIFGYELYNNPEFWSEDSSHVVNSIEATGSAVDFLQSSPK